MSKYPYTVAKSTLTAEEESFVLKEPKGIKSGLGN